MVTVSKKHGVNPSLEVCYWCGEEKNSIILFGRLPDDKEAPRYSCINYDPCQLLTLKR
jgi:hypothetical protein